ncbi:hypothetical protein CPB86DRAFT_750146 [Serendipita vermifera]|nr:hypothetical protein CPB86DRAFT_750146 [Serendipita vermifera]
MNSDIIDEGSRLPASLFGIGRDNRRQGNLVITEETTAWEIYNSKAAQIDRERVKDWNDSLNTLLIFAALYSAALTAFIVESMKLLREDSTDSTRDILLVISRQLANSSLPAFVEQEFEAPTFAIVLNSLLFTSLSCSLIAALSAVLALQWVANYDMGLNTSSARKRALQRHVRSMGIDRWKMAQLIATLPILIFIALFLFFIGIAVWLWHLHRAISGITIAGIGIGGLLYIITTTISIFNPDAPFRTPVSKGSQGLLKHGRAWAKLLTTEFPSTILKSGGLRNALHSGQFRKIWETARTKSVSPRETFEKREEIALERNDSAATDSLLWLATRLELSSNSRKPLLILLEQFTKLSADALMNTGQFKNGQWEDIFTMLCNPYFGRGRVKAYRDQKELRLAGILCKALSMISSGINSPAFQVFYRSLMDTEDASISAAARLAFYRHTGQLQYLLDALSRSCQSISEIEPNYFHFILLNVRGVWQEMDDGDKRFVFDELAYACSVPSNLVRGKSVIPLIPIRLIDILLDLMAQSVVPISDTIEGKTAADRYASAVHQVNENHFMHFWALRLHRSIQQQLLAQISRLNMLSPTGRNEYVALLNLLLSITRLGSDVLALHGEERDNFICIMARSYTEYENAEPVDNIAEALFTGLQDSLIQGNNHLERWRGLIKGFDGLSSRRSNEDQSHILRAFRRLLSRYDPDLARMSAPFRDELNRIRDPSIALILSWRLPDDWEIPSLTSPQWSEWDASVESRAFETWGYLGYEVVGSRSRIAFLRALLIDGPPGARKRAIQLLEGNIIQESDENQWRAVFSSPVLERILGYYTISEESSMSTIFTKIIQYKWFYEEFDKANGLEWLPHISLGNAPNCGIITHLLVDQIVFSTASKDIKYPLISSYYYLQTLGTTPILGVTTPNRQSDEVRFLRDALLWLMRNSVDQRGIPGDNTGRGCSRADSGVPTFAIIGRRKVGWYGWPSGGELRSLDSVKEMSIREWEEWTVTLKVLAMGATLGGLKPGLDYNGSRFIRDPDCVCGTRAY